MATFTHDGVTLAYDDIAPAGGADRTIVLVHGFASNRNEGWRRTGWYGAFERRGIRVIGLDQRGHGESEKLYDSAAYSRQALAGDLLALMDHLDLGRADLFGYSMGSRTVLAAALAAPERVSNLILGGVGGKLLTPQPRPAGNPMAEALLTDDPETISQPMLRSFRHFADEQGEDRQALAAFTGVENPAWDRADFARLTMPVLVVAGQRDDGGDPAELAAAFPHGHGVSLPGCDHFSAIPHALTKAAVFDFLDGLLDDPFPEGF
jgi:pimeloyl-ACP methyl ester carboxylesterase